MKCSAVLRSLGAATLLAPSCPAAAAEQSDAVLRWNEIAQQAVAPANAYVQSRGMAITQLAILDAVKRAGPGTKAAPEARSISADAAVAAAAHASLTALAPDSAAALDAALAAERARIEDDASEAAGIKVGQDAAADILARRKNDGWDAKIDY